jgi:uncharacterized protein YxjI
MTARLHRCLKRGDLGVSKFWFRIRDMYGIEVGSGENDALIIAAAVDNDEMAGH